MIRLKNWSVFRSDKNGYLPPELAACHLQGSAYGHPRFQDGSPVSTSRIVRIDDKDGHREVTTKSGSVYVLYREDVDPACEQQFPNYYERLKVAELVN